MRFITAAMLLLLQVATPAAAQTVVNGRAVYVDGVRLDTALARYCQLTGNCQFTGAIAAPKLLTSLTTASLANGSVIAFDPETFTPTNAVLPIATYGLTYNGYGANGVQLSSFGPLNFLTGGALRWTITATGDIQVGADNANRIGQQVARLSAIYATKVYIGNGTILVTSGAGSPEGAVTANVGSLYMRSDGGAGTTEYVKESGTGNTGWIAK